MEVKEAADNALQLAALAQLTREFEAHGIEYWLFGGWAVDFHVGHITRAHADLDLAIWQADVARVLRRLDETGWEHRPQPEEEGYTTYVRDGVSMDLAYLERDDMGMTFTPVRDGRAEWPKEAFATVEATLQGIRARVISRAALIAEKAPERDDPATAAKDRADVASLVSERP